MEPTKRINIAVGVLAAKLLRLRSVMIDGSEPATMQACIGEQLREIVGKEGQQLVAAYDTVCDAIPYMDVEKATSIPDKGLTERMDCLAGLDAHAERYTFQMRLPIYILDRLRIASALLHRTQGDLADECIKRHITHLVDDDTEWAFYVEGVRRMVLAPKGSKED